MLPIAADHPDYRGEEKSLAHVAHGGRNQAHQRLTVRQPVRHAAHCLCQPLPDGATRLWRNLPGAAADRRRQNRNQRSETLADRTAMQ
jgi:hypothetical protein